ncbi:MAG: hypothetical protein K9G65_02455 [Rickettsiaceae bacterium]|nr:hypothetical protein [Rickettsiaceae bacterium]
MQNLSLFESNSQPFIIDNHLSFNFNDYTTLNLATFHSLTETKSYTPITGCVLEHVLTTTNLTSCEKLYYLIADSLSIISKNKGYGRYCALPSEDWAEYLGCSRSLVFTMQRSLVKKGYFIINKDFDEIGRNNRNLITPTLPTSVFNHLNEKFLDRAGDHTPYNRFVECKRSYLDRTKLFIKLNYDLLKIISSNEYPNSRQKVMWLGFYTSCYKNYMLLAKKGFGLGGYSYSDDSSFSFITSYNELAELHSCNTKYISKTIKALEKLGFIKTKNIYIRKKGGSYDDCMVQERQDKSLWKITLSLPAECILELEKIKDRSNLKLKDVQNELAVAENNVDPKLIEDCLILGGIKFNLNLEQSHLLRSLIDVDSNHSGLDGDNINYEGNTGDSSLPLPDNSYDVSYDKSYIDSVMEELDVEEVGKLKDKLEDSSDLDGDSHSLSDEPETLSTSSSLEEFDKKIEKNDGINSDPHVAKSGLLLNKDLISKIKDIKSNLGATPKVLFNDLLKRFSKDDCEKVVGGKKECEGRRGREFNIHSELVREKLKILPKDKADKARKFAYSLVSKGLTKGYAASLSKHELAKQMIHHAATWKPTKLENISKEKEIDTALSVAWKKIVGGTWQLPLELAKAEILQYEYSHHKEKYLRSGILSHEISTLEVEVDKLLGGWYNLAGKIIEGSKVSPALHYDTVTLPLPDLEFNKESKTNDEERWLTMVNSSPKSPIILSGRAYNNYETKLVINDYNRNLAKLEEEQQYVEIISNNYESSHIETIGDKNYHLKFREIDIDTRRNFSIATQHIQENTLNKSIARAGSTGASIVINTIGNNKQLQQEVDMDKGFRRIDEALFSIFTKVLS